MYFLPPSIDLGLLIDNFFMRTLKESPCEVAYIHFYNGFSHNFYILFYFLFNNYLLDVFFSSSFEDLSNFSFTIKSLNKEMSEGIICEKNFHKSSYYKFKSPNIFSDFFLLSLSQRRKDREGITLSYFWPKIF